MSPLWEADVKGDTAHACAKISYATRTETREALKSIDRRRGKRGLMAYKCKRCQFWHLGHSAKTQKKQAAKSKGGHGVRPPLTG